MRCKRFDEQVADWVAQRLPEDAAAAMAEHALHCAECRRAAEFERGLRHSMGLLGRSQEEPNLWAGVHARIAAVRPAPRSRIWAVRWAFGGALAAGCAAAFLWLMAGPGRPPLPHAAEASADEAKAVQMAAAIQQLPDPDIEFTGDSSQHIPMLQRAVLLGGGK
ncbi:MAG: hypothetical protein ACP5VE_08635 [Chthonomonadales bacterium]